MNTRLSVVVLASGLLLQGAAVWTATPEAAAQQPAATVTFHKDVAPILQKNCETCHRPGQIGPFSTQTYKDARPWAKAIKAAVVARKMPPWTANPKYGHFINDKSLEQAEIDTITAWVDGGAIEGNAKDAPPPMTWAAGGFLVKPDVVLDFPPYTVPARGIREWERIAFPAPFKEDVWVTSWEVLPGAPEVVHHMCFGFKKSTGDTPYNEYQWMEVPRDEDGNTTNRKEILSGPRDNTGAMYGTVASRKVGSTEVTRRQGRQFPEGTPKLCYLPGQGLEDYRPAQTGIFVPAGSEITINLHYTPNGLETVDISKIGFTVTKVRPPMKLLSRGGEGAERDETGAEELAIPPNEGSYKAPIFITSFPRDTEIAYFRPHAHVRGKSIRETLIYPDGREEIVLDVPRYDFNWQLTYWTSIKVPKGSKLRTEWYYDNSSNNRYNPNPNQWVYWGQQSWEEMGGASFGAIIPADADTSEFEKKK